MTKLFKYEIPHFMMKLYKIPLQKLTPVTNFQPRESGANNQPRFSGANRLQNENTRMSYRYYPSWSTHTLVLFHGLVSNSMYLSTLAHRLAERKIAQVIIPDWRGHGDDRRKLSWEKNHDVIQDFEEMLIHMKARTAVERISFLGHSFGAKWMLKILNDSPSSFKVDHGFLIAPFLKNEQLKMDGWFTKTAEYYKLAWPENLKTEKEVTQYPLDFLDHFELKKEVLEKLIQKIPMKLIEGGQDEILQTALPLPVEKSISIPEATHMGIVMDMKCVDLICDEIEKTTPI